MTTSLDKWRAVTQSPQVVAFFKGLFDRVGIRVSDTGEAFTCVHRGDRVDFEPGLDEGGVDYTVVVHSSQIDRLAAHARTGELDPSEQYRIVSALFTPATAATQGHPVLSNPWVRWLSGAEDVIHVRLLPPAGAEPVEHTLVYANRQWLAFPGLHGRPRRTYRLSAEQALDFHRRVFALLKANRFGEWVNYGLWYRKWRQGVSQPA